MGSRLLYVPPVVDMISNAASVDELIDAFGAICSRFGFANMAYHAVCLPHADRPHPLVLVTYDPDWVRRYTESNYFRTDPVVKTAAKRALPVDWGDVDHESREAKGMFAEADVFGVGRNGLTIPVRGFGGERALLSITSNLSSHEWSQRRVGILSEFHYIAYLIHDRAVQLSGLRGSNIQHPLSPRELQCMEFAARGLTPKQIAASLQLSATAVRQYLKGARLKLGCSTVNEGIAKAVRLEIITI